MNAFQRRIKTLEAVSDVVDVLEYRVNDEKEHEQHYVNRAEDCRDDDGNLDPDNYYLCESIKHIEGRKIYEELIEYLQKKYLK